MLFAVSFLLLIGVSDVCAQNYAKICFEQNGKTPEYSPCIYSDADPIVIRATDEYIDVLGGIYMIAEWYSYGGYGGIIDEGDVTITFTDLIDYGEDLPGVLIESSYGEVYKTKLENIEKIIYTKQEDNYLIDVYLTTGAKKSYEMLSTVVTLYYWNDFPTAINTISSNNINIHSIPCGIAIETKETASISVYNLSGQIVYQSIVDGREEVYLDKGVYIAKMNDESRKIVIK